MSRETIPADIRRFILTSILSVPYLEAMLLLRNEPDTLWNGREVGQRLYIGDTSALALLAQLEAAQVLSKTADQPPLYRYDPAVELREMIDRLADIYARQLLEVTHLIHSRLDKRARQFADAFKWRQDS
jgi:hypothetical protein